jgi:phospholipid/cholesterol/gamma-HCH transport system ATP-binding protein
MIQFIDVSKSFNSHQVLKGVDLRIPDKKITIILGPSGEGKSVLLKHMMGLLRPDKGKVIVDGTDLSTLDERQFNEFRKKFGMLFQNAALFDSLNVEENVAFPLKEHTSLSEREIRRKVEEKLALVGLVGAMEKMPSDLSGGMRKRVGLARAIALEPKIILYDEPTTGLDPLMTDTINRLIRDTQKKLNVTSVVISHDLEAAFRIADFVAMLYQGKIIAQGDPDEFKKSDHPFVRKFIEGRGD